MARIRSPLRPLNAPSKLACCAFLEGYACRSHRAFNGPYMVLPSLLLILSATRLIGLLLRASTSTAQSVIISFTTRARWASTRGQQPSSFVFPRAHSGSTGAICVSFLSFWCTRWASTRDQRGQNLLSRKRSSAFISHAQNVSVPSTTITHCPPTFTE